MENKLPSYNPTGKVYNFDQLDAFLSDPDVINGMNCVVSSGKRLKYINCPASFDIETSSFYVSSGTGADKVAIMYIWQFGINGAVIYGRHWHEFFDLLRKVVNNHNLSIKKRLLIYCHNLSFEFQFLKEHFEWDKVFSLKTRVPIYAISGGLEFRCSYKLSNYSLDYLGKNLLTKYKVEKKTGDLDYAKIRHAYTELSQKEIDYAVYDVYVVMAYIREKIEAEGNDISKIPLTNTGYVRRHCRDLTMSSQHYRGIITRLQVSTTEYNQLKRAFMGGFTHANIEHANQMLKNVTSFDIASDYPARIVLDYFPMSKGKLIGKVDNLKTLKYYLENFCCIFDFACANIRPSVTYENILSVSRCKFLEGQKNYQANNGRLVACDGWIRTTLTELDYENLCAFYTWDYWEIRNLRIYDRAYLPTEFVSAVLDFYEKKTTLKGVEGKEIEYMVAKNMLNSTFGMMVTDIVRDESIYNDYGWMKSVPELEDAITKYNKSWNRFLFYPWGVYVTAHARNQLFKMMRVVEDDYVYSDTDSLKILNGKKHLKEFESYNNDIYDKICFAAEHHNIPIQRFMPVDPKGNLHPIGVFENDGVYDLFKTCGAKRYMCTTGDKTTITVAGLGKAAGMKYIEEEYGPVLREMYDAFTDGLFVPKGKSGKLTHTYIDSPKAGLVTDYTGKQGFYYEESSTHLEPASFTMSMLDTYLRYLYGVEEDIYRE